jgi:hypothetical protein
VADSLVWIALRSTRIAIHTRLSGARESRSWFRLTNPVKPMIEVDGPAVLGFDRSQ